MQQSILVWLSYHDEFQNRALVWAKFGRPSLIGSTLSRVQAGLCILVFRLRPICMSGSGNTSNYWNTLIRRIYNLRSSETIPIPPSFYPHYPQAQSRQLYSSDIYESIWICKRLILVVFIYEVFEPPSNKVCYDSLITESVGTSRL